jgi:hypothetical protein
LKKKLIALSELLLVETLVFGLSRFVDIVERLSNSTVQKKLIYTALQRG